ncbi:MAG TPA: hypothetical protein VGL82_10505 [Bryobacteraceae bacterium]|jgi:hypothetical protein
MRSAGTSIFPSACAAYVVFSLVFFFTLTPEGAYAQQSDPGAPILSVRPTLVEVPALVKTKQGNVSVPHLPHQKG